MFIKNYTNANLTFNAKGNQIVLLANQVTNIPDGLTSLEELQKMFGLTAVGTEASGPSISVLQTQQVLELGKLYSTDVLVGEIVRLFIGVDGTVNVYGSDSKTIPASLSQMSCPESNTDVTGSCAFGSVPRYIAIKATSGTPELIITNCKCYEVKSIS